jgi:hypothetical protein
VYEVLPERLRKEELWTFPFATRRLSKSVTLRFRQQGLLIFPSAVADCLQSIDAVSYWFLKGIARYVRAMSPTQAGLAPPAHDYQALQVVFQLHYVAGVNAIICLDLNR